MNEPLGRALGALRNNPQVRNISLLAGGTAFSQALLLLATPVITRIYSPEWFGVLAVYTSLVQIINSFNSGSYELAVPLPEEERDARVLVRMVLGLILATAMVAPIVVGWIARRGLIVFPGSWPWLHLALPIGILGIGGLQVETYWLIRRKAFRVTATAKILQTLATIILQVGLGLLCPGALPLVLGLVGAQALALVYMHAKGRLGRFEFNVGGFWGLAKRYHKFPKYNMLAGFIGSLGIFLGPMVLARSFSPAVAGNYSLALRVLYFPITLLGQAISQVWFAEWVALRNDPEASRGKLEMGIGILLAISIPSFLILILHGPFLFSLLFGTKWVGAGQIARVLAVWFIFLFVSSPLSPLMVVHERLGLQLGLSTAETILRLGALYAGIRMGSATAAICGLALAGTLISIIYIGVLLHLSGSGFLRLWKHVWRQVLAGLTVLLAGVGIAQIPANATILRCLSLAMGFAFLAWSLVGSLRASRLIRA